MNKGAIVRAILVFIAIINTGFQMMNIPIIDVSNDLVWDIVSYVYDTVVIVISFWKNNSFTREAVTTDKVLKLMKTLGYNVVTAAQVVHEEGAE